MADNGNGIVIAVKGPDGSGRTLVAEQIKRLLTESGFTDVTLMTDGNAPDLYQGPGALKDQHLLIAEVKTP